MVSNGMLRLSLGTMLPAIARAHELFRPSHEVVTFCKLKFPSLVKSSNQLRKQSRRGEEGNAKDDEKHGIEELVAVADGATDIRSTRLCY